MHSAWKKEAFKKYPEHSAVYSHKLNLSPKKVDAPERLRSLWRIGCHYPSFLETSRSFRTTSYSQPPCYFSSAETAWPVLRIKAPRAAQTTSFWMLTVLFVTDFFSVATPFKTHRSRGRAADVFFTCLIWEVLNMFISVCVCEEEFPLTFGHELGSSYILLLTPDCAFQACTQSLYSTAPFTRLGAIYFHLRAFFRQMALKRRCI